MDSSQKKIKNNKTRIGVNIRIYEQKPSGIQNFIRGLFTELIQYYSHYQFIFFSTGKKKIEEHAEYIIASSPILSIIRKINPLLVNIFFDNFYILKLIYTQNLDIFVGSSYILPVIKPKNMKYVTVIYDLSYLTYKHNPYKLYLNLVMYMKFIVPFVLKRSDAVIVPSLYVRNQIKKKYNTNVKKMIVIYGGRDEYFHKVANTKKYNILKRKYHISQQYCFTNATNPERKNITGLIEAFKTIDKISDMQLIITGLLPEETIVQLRGHIDRLNLSNKIIFLGYVTKEELRILYSYAKVFIFPSFEEGFGFPILEAAVCGCLPICSDTGALPELLGNKKLLFNPRDVASITKKINEVLLFNQRDYAKELSIVAKHMQQFTWKNTAKQYDQLFQRLLEENI